MQAAACQYRFNLLTLQTLGLVEPRENLNNREQTDSTTVDKGVRCYPNFQLYRAFIEGRGVCKVTTISVCSLPLSAI